MTYKYFKHFTVILLLISLLMIAGNKGLNAEDNSEKRIVHEVVVQGEAVEKAATVTVVTAEQIEKRGIQTVAQALEMVPGTHVRVGGKGEAYIRIRGFRQREIAVLIDGLPVNSPYDGQLDLSNLPVHNIERIDIVKGASSVMYGANAMGGVINIITRKTGGKQQLQLNGQYGTGEAYQFGANIKGQQGKIRYFVGGTYENQDYYPLSNDYSPALNQDEGHRENSDKKGWTGRVNLDWDMGNNAGMGIGFTHIDLEKGLPHHESDKKAKYWRFSDWKEGVVDIFYHKRFKTITMESKVYYQYFQNVLQGYDDGSYTTQDSKNGFTSSYDDYALGGDVFFRIRPNSTHLFKTAMRFRRDVHRDQADTGEEWLKYNINLLTLPLEGEWSVSKQMTVVYGASLDMMFFEAEESSEKKNKVALNPQVSLLWNPLERLQLKASASLKTRFPSMKELFSSTSGNPDLDPMKSTGLEAGFEYYLSNGLSISLVGFYNNISDLINRIQKNDPYINIDKAEFSGIEAGLNWQWSTFNRFYAAYTRLHAVDKSGGGTEYIQYRPKHKLDAGIFMKIPADLRLNLNLSYVSKQLYYDDDNMEQSLDPYTLLDVRLSRRVGQKLEIYITALNVFDVNYYESEGYPREGRRLYAGLKLELGK